MKNIIIDCDPGHDDMLAIMTALSKPDINVLGVTTVFGNQNVEKVTRNTLNILNLLEKRIDVCAGSTKPLTRELTNGVGDELHGESGLGGYDLEYSPQVPIQIDVVEYLRTLICESKQKIILVATAPLTNIAKLIIKHPETLDNIEYISIMGGALKEGNITKYAEFNFWADPEAAKIVLESQVNIVMAGLEATHEASMSFDYIEKMSLSNKKIEKIVGKLNLYHVNAFKDIWNMDFVPVHDACSVLYITNPELFDSVEHGLTINTTDEFRGKVELVSNKTSNVKVLTSTNTNKFLVELQKVLDYFDYIK